MTTGNGGMFDCTIRSFLEEAWAATPTPGGGSAAALVGAIAAAMAGMAANFTQRGKFAAVSAEMRDAAERLKGWVRECERLLAADIVSFERYMAALKLPKSTEEEKVVRQEELRAATHAAIEVPLGLMRVCRDALRLTAAIAPAANPNVISDLGIGAVLFEASAQSAYLTVEINVAALKDAETASRYDADAVALLRACAESKRTTIDAVRSVIWKGR